MTMNKYYFMYRHVNFVIHAKDIPDAFIPWRRLMGKNDVTQSDFEKELLDPPKNLSDCYILVGESLSVQEIRSLVFSAKVPAFKHAYKKEPKPVIPGSLVPVEAIKESYGKVYTDAPPEIAKALENSIPVTEDQGLGDGWKELPPVKRGRGRPKGSKNKTVSIQSYIEE